MSRHFAELRKDSIHVVIGINKRDNHGQVPTGFNEMCRTHLAAAKKPSDRMKHYSSSNILLAQVLENLQVQRTIGMRGAFFSLLKIFDTTTRA